MKKLRQSRLLFSLDWWTLFLELQEVTTSRNSKLRVAKTLPLSFASHSRAKPENLHRWCCWPNWRPYPRSKHLELRSRPTWLGSLRGFARPLRPKFLGFFAEPRIGSRNLRLSGGHLSHKMENHSHKPLFPCPWNHCETCLESKRNQTRNNVSTKHQTKHHVAFWWKVSERYCASSSSRLCSALVPKIPNNLVSTEFIWALKPILSSVDILTTKKTQTKKKIFHYHLLRIRSLGLSASFELFGFLFNGCPMGSTGPNQVIFQGLTAC